MACQQFLANRVAEIVGQNVRGLDTEVSQQRLVHIGVVVHRVLVGDGLVGETHAEHVGCDHGESLGQPVPQRRPVPRVERIAVNEQQVFSGALGAIEDVEAQIVEVLASGFPAFEFGVHAAEASRTPRLA